MEWTKQTYNEQYEKWVPWLEDLYLRYFTKDNKASYTTEVGLSTLEKLTKHYDAFFFSF